MVEKQRVIKTSKGYRRRKMTEHPKVKWNRRLGHSPLVMLIAHVGLLAVIIWKFWPPLFI